jgi:predicted NBD/HSP70 family sugar kinase
MKGGLDLGGTKVQAVVVDDAHEVRGQARRPPTVRLAALGDLGGAIGASLLIDGKAPAPAPE